MREWLLSLFYCANIVSTFRPAFVLASTSMLLAASHASTEDGNVRVFAVAKGRQVALVAKLENCTHATITVSAELENMVSSPPLPVTVDSDGRREFEIAILSIDGRPRKIGYSFHFDFRPGARLTGQPKPFDYSLPFRGGPYRVVQGPRGEESHQKGSENEEAIDWTMPIGTKVYPARDGQVVALRQDCPDNAPGEPTRPDFNYLIIRHEDGTFAEYQHLTQNGVLVKLGDKVTTVQPVALSGNSGPSRQPHLHFDVFVNESGKKRKTLPVTFRPTNGDQAAGGRARRPDL